MVLTLPSAVPQPGQIGVLLMETAPDELPLPPASAGIPKLDGPDEDEQAATRPIATASEKACPARAERCASRPT
jgi:hypothetical protein